MTRMRAEPLMTFGAVASLLAAGGGALIGAPTAAVVGIAVVGFGWVGVRAATDLGIEPPRPSWAQVRSLAFVALVVTTGVASPMMTGSAVAVSQDAQRCDPLEFVWIDGTNSECNIVTVSEVNQALAQEDNQTQNNLEAAALAQAQSSEIYLDTSSNYIQDSRAVAWGRAEMAIAEAYQNGSNESVARAAGKEAIRKYYAQRQLQVIGSYNTTNLAAYDIAKRGKNEGISDQVVTYSNQDNLDPSGNRSKSITLANGEDAHTFEWNTYSDYGVSSFTSFKQATLLNLDGDGSNRDRVYINQSEVFVDIPAYKNRFDELHSTSDSLESQVDQYVTNTYPAFQNGTINASNVISRTTYQFQAGLSGADGTASYSNQLAAYSAMGLSSPNLSTTGTVTIEYPDGSNATGMIYTTGSPPNGTWETGVTYNATTLPGVERFVTTSGNSSEISGEFTLTRITGPNGNTTTSAAVTNYSYVTTNNTDLKEKLERLRALNEQIEEKQAVYGGGSGGGLFGGGNGRSSTLVLGLLAALAALLLLNN